MASREPLISSDGPKNSSHCTESSESERASPRPMLQKAGPPSQHRINRGGSSTSPREPSAPFSAVRNNVKPFHSTGPQRHGAHALKKVSADAKTKTCRCPSRERPSRASSYAAQLSSHHKTHMNTATRRCFLAQRTECETKQEQNVRAPRQPAAAVPCAGRQSVARGAPVIKNRARASQVMKTFSTAPHAFAVPVAVLKN